MTREEAIKEIKFWDFLNEKETEAIETLIPELRESEDERIRRKLIEIIGYFRSRGIDQQLCEEFLAYLEKQKTSEEAIRYVKENHSPDEVSDFQAAMNIAVAKAYDKGVQDTLEKQKEQKIPITGNDFGWIDELKHDLEHPEELDQKVDDVLKQRKGIRALEQKPAEWSEEDEEMRGTCIDLLEHFPRPCGEVIGPWKDCIVWLKSLRPQSHWKPSKEQIGALENARYMMSQSGDYYDTTAIIDSLIIDLQKLK